MWSKITTSAGYDSSQDQFPWLNATNPADNSKAWLKIIASAGQTELQAQPQLQLQSYPYIYATLNEH
jgi:hypothetical protein